MEKAADDQKRDRPWGDLGEERSAIAAEVVARGAEVLMAQICKEKGPPWLPHFFSLFVGYRHRL
jgi:hypothetical protein